MTQASSGQLLRGTQVNVADLIALRGIKLPSRLSRAPVTGSRSGARLSRQRGRGVDFSEVRLYQAGDDVRSIDWRVTARKAKPHTKLYREERERPTLVVVDQSRSMCFGSQVRLKSVAAAECAAILAWHAVDAGDRVGGLVFDDATEYPFKPLRNARTVVRFLNQVQRSNAALLDAVPPLEVLAGAPLHRALSHLARTARTGFRLYLISDFARFDERDEQQLRRIARHNSVVLIQISDVLERELPPPDRYTITDGLQHTVLMTGADATRRRYREAFERLARKVEDACIATRSQYITLSTHEAAVTRLSERLVS